MKLMSKIDDQKVNQIISLMQRDDSIDAPADAIRWSKNIFLTRAAKSKTSIVQKVLAVLQMDLSPNRAAFGERSASASQARQMLFQAGENALDIRISETKKGFNLHGQILGKNFANAVVKIGKFQTTAGETSEFKLTEIPAGKYDLTLQGDEKEIVIEDLEIN